MRKELLGNSAEEAISGDDKGGEGAAAGLSIHLVAPVPVQWWYHTKRAMQSVAHRNLQAT